jgi:hypothetical protein
MAIMVRLAGEIRQPSRLKAMVTANKQRVGDGGECQIARVIVKPQALEVCLIPTCKYRLKPKITGLMTWLPCCPTIPTITLRLTGPSYAAIKGIIRASCAGPAIGKRHRSSSARQLLISYQLKCADQLIVRLAKQSAVDATG